MTVEKLIEELLKVKNKQSKVILDGNFHASEIEIDEEKAIVNII
jgi:hypothetical protein